MGCTGSKTSEVKAASPEAPAATANAEQFEGSLPNLHTSTSTAKVEVQKAEPETTPLPPCHLTTLIAGAQAEPTTPAPQKSEQGISSLQVEVGGESQGSASKGEVTAATNMSATVVKDPSGASADKPVLVETGASAPAEGLKGEDTAASLGITVTGAPTAPAPVCNGLFSNCCKQPIAVE